MRFAKLENNIILAFFLAYFKDLQLLDENERPVSQPPPVDLNSQSARKPKRKCYLKYAVR